MSNGYRIDPNVPILLDGCTYNGKPPGGTAIYYKGSKIEFTGDRDNIAYELFKGLQKQIMDHTDKEER